MIPSDPSYWSDYAHAPNATEVEAVQLISPTLIDGAQFDAGDWSIRTKQGVYYGVKKEVFQKEYLPLTPRGGPDRDDRLFHILDDLCTEVAKLRLAMERYGMLNNGAQK